MEVGARDAEKVLADAEAEGVRTMRGVYRTPGEDGRTMLSTFGGKLVVERDQQWFQGTAERAVAKMVETGAADAEEGRGGDSSPDGDSDEWSHYVASRATNSL